MATIETAKTQFVNELKAAGMIHPHSGQEAFVRGALDKFAAEITKNDAAPDTDAAELLPVDDVGSGTEKAGDGDFAGDGDPYGIAQEYTGQSFAGAPSAEDLDAVSEEQAAKDATGPVDQADGGGTIDTIQAMAEMPMKGLSKLGGAMAKGGFGKKEAESKGGERESEGEKASLEIHDHGDGTAHSMVGGEKTEHPDHMHAVAHVAHHLMPEGGHFHGHHDGFSMKSHAIHETGEHAETTEHETPEEMHQALDETIGGTEGAEHGEPDGDEGGSPTLGGFRG